MTVLASGLFTSHPATAARSSGRLAALGRVLAAVAGVGLLALLATWRLDAYPTTWFDEGSHLHVPRTLVLHGVYADISSEGFRYYGPTAGVGPTVLLPIAAAFKLAGVGLLQARLVVVAYLLLTVGLFYLLGQRLLSRSGALVATLLLVSSPGINLLVYGRQVLGEVPALAFLLAGLLAWERALTDPGRGGRWLGLAALGLGLCAMTKSQFALLLVPTFVVLLMVDRCYYRAAGPVAFLAPLAGVAGGVAANLLAQVAPLIGSHDLATTLAVTREASAGAIFSLSPRRTLSAVKFLTGPEALAYLAVPGALYGLVRARERSRRGLFTAALTAFVLIGMLWFAVGSIGWPRYAFPALAIGALLTTLLLADLWAVLGAAGRAGARRSLPLLAAFGLVLTIANPLLTALRDVATAGDRSPHQMAAYLQTEVPLSSVVETWEPELGLLTDHAYHSPPRGWLERAVRAQWLDQQDTPPAYDPRPEADVDYLVVGPFGKYTRQYDWLLKQTPNQRLASFGPYDLYQLGGS